jgi:hypothetical protein
MLLLLEVFIVVIKWLGKYILTIHNTKGIYPEIGERS